MPLEKALLGALGRLLRLDPEVLRLVAASVINYNIYIDIDIDIYVLMRYKPTNAMIFGLDTMWAPKSWVVVFGK